MPDRERRETRERLSAVAERALEEAGYPLMVEEDQGALVVSGIVNGEADRDAVLDILRRVAPGVRVDPGISVAGAYPAEMQEASLSEVEVGGFAGAEPGLSDAESSMPGDFTDQQRVTSPLDVQPGSLSGGARALTRDDHRVTEGDAVYVPPTDPVGTDREVIGGFSASSMDSLEVERSGDGTLGDEAIADAVRRELREDAATTGLVLEVEVNQGVVRLRGAVEDLLDVESAEEVAARVPGVMEVAEELEVAGLTEEEEDGGPQRAGAGEEGR